MAAAIADVTGADPYYLIGKTDINQECTEERLRQFLCAQGYEKLLNSAGSSLATKPFRGSGRSRKAPEKTVNEVETVIENDEAKDNTQKSSDILAFAQEIINNLSPEERKNLDEMNEEAISLLLKGFTLRSKLLPEAKILMDYIKIILLK